MFTMNILAVDCLIPSALLTDELSAKLYIDLEIRMNNGRIGGYYPCGFC